MIEDELKLRTAGRSPLGALPGQVPAEDRPPGRR
jgi:hypothetical protein